MPAHWRTHRTLPSMAIEWQEWQEWFGVKWVTWGDLARGLGGHTTNSVEDRVPVARANHHCRASHVLRTLDAKDAPRPWPTAGERGAYVLHTASGIRISALPRLDTPGRNTLSDHRPTLRIARHPAHADGCHSHPGQGWLRPFLGRWRGLTLRSVVVVPRPQTVHLGADQRLPCIPSVTCDIDVALQCIENAC